MDIYKFITMINLGGLYDVQAIILNLNRKEKLFLKSLLIWLFLFIDQDNSKTCELDDVDLLVN